MIDDIICFYKNEFLECFSDNYGTPIIDYSIVENGEKLIKISVFKHSDNTCFFKYDVADKFSSESVKYLKNHLNKNLKNIINHHLKEQCSLDFIYKNLVYEVEQCYQDIKRGYCEK